jgi:DUF1680 family protein
MKRLASLVILLLVSATFSGMCVGAEKEPAARPEVNLALVATPSTSFVSGHETLAAVNDGFTPAHSDDKSHGAYGNWPRSGTQWVEYDWPQPISTAKIDVYWFDDNRGVRLPKAYRVKYWDGKAFVEVPKPAGLGREANRFQTTTFDEVTTSKLRLEIDSSGTFSTGLLEWRVYDSGKSPNFAPAVSAGVDRVVVLGGQTYLRGAVRDDGKPSPAPTVRWSKASGPGDVTFADPATTETTAKFSAIGNYVLKLTADDGQASASSTVAVSVDPAPPAKHLEPVATTKYRITSPFWRARAKAQIVHWIPHCIRKIDDPKLPEGGIENFVLAANKLAGKPAKHQGPPFANAWVYMTMESMCVALTVDPQGDREIEEAQTLFRKTLEDWIPKVLSAQETDGYLQTQYTIHGTPRWTNKADHEGYNAANFIEAGIAHHIATGGKDARLYDAARRLADCWCRHIGPAPKRTWYEGHQNLEQVLVRLARHVNQIEGPGKGQAYLDLAKYLLDARQNGEEYDQSHLPVTRQYEAVGHAVRAVYGYSAMADIAMEFGDLDYHSATRSLWDSIVDRKYYVTGGIGSGETSEGFGKDFSLPNGSYCESCAGCGQLFFGHKMQLAYQEARYADQYEETLYNAILGSVDLEGKNFTYTNPLDSSERRYLWHVCPCCIGNIPRTLLELPTWMYSRSDDALYVNLFVGSEVDVGRVGGTNVRAVQTTEYPWKGKVSIRLEPAQEAKFALKIREPHRQVSLLYMVTPESDGITSIAVNGEKVCPQPDGFGYFVLERRWKAGDTVELELPLCVQRVKADERIAATRGRVALRYGPLVYNIESVDQNVDSVLSPTAPLAAEWDEKLLGGVMVIRGKFADGKPLLAIPNYARLNRGGRSVVWIKDR